MRKSCGVATMCLAYVVFTEIMGATALNTRTHRPRDDASLPLHGFLNSIDGLPTFARWDSIWFYGIATEGYTGVNADSHLTPAFLPLYPLLMGALGDAIRSDYLITGTWISRLALLVALLLLGPYSRETEGTATAEWMVPGTLLTFPSAFILVSVYSEALFLAFALGAFVLARQGRHGWAALAACGASLTRIHGLALIPALAVLGWEQWHGAGRSAVRRAQGADKKRYGGLETCPAVLHARWLPALPALGAAAGYLAIGAYFWVALGDPLAHFAAKREGWAQWFTAPWVTLERAIDHFQRAVTDHNLGALYTVLELPCLYLIAGTLGVLCSRRLWAEATYVCCAAAMSLCSGSLAGLPRYTLVMFPVFVVLTGLRRWPVLWGLSLLVGAALQGCLLVNFVRFGAPPP